MSIGKKLRFEVFKRDKFTCQYCGRSSPQVILHVDHIHPKAEGGSDEIINLITSCSDCNLGKGARLLSDDSVIVRQKRQLDNLQERREQMEMMIEWRRGLFDVEQDIAQKAFDLFRIMCHRERLTINQNGLDNLKSWIDKWGLDEVIEAMHICSTKYLEYISENAEPSICSIINAFSKIPGICYNRERTVNEPWLAMAYYIRGILKNRFNLDRYPAEYTSIINKISAAVGRGKTIDEIKTIATTSESYEDFIAQINRGDDGE